MKKLTTVKDLRARRAEVAALAQRHAAKHDSKASLPTARRYADRLARLDARILAAQGLSDECPQCSRIGAGPLCKSHRAPAPRQTQNFLHGEALDPAYEAYCDEQAALSRYEDAARPDHDTRDREGREEPDAMTVLGAARMYLTHVHDGVAPSDVNALAWLAEAGRVLVAAGIDRLNVAQLRAAAGLPALPEGK